jgi:4-hydroxy-tetrahydrodipicolinate reductase
MNIILIGYGKMGKTIERLAIERGHSIVARLDRTDSLETALHTSPDVAIEFSTPDTALENIKKCIAYKVPVVSGTTGWLENKAEADAFCLSHGGSFFYASNFSLGVNMFLKINEQLAAMLNKYPEYEISMDEIHHTEKKDAPSGTAISIAERIINNLSRKKSWVKGDANQPEEIGIRSFRIDMVPGTHVVRYYSAIDDIELKHTAHSRDGFAQGAVLAAEWIVGKTGVFNMNNLLAL